MRQQMRTGKAIEDRMMSAASCGGIFSLIENGEQGKEAVIALTQEVLAAIRQRHDDLDELKQHPWQEVRGIHEAVMRMQRFCKCMLHLLNVPFHSASDTDNTPAINHVLWFTQFSGKLIFERSIKQVLTGSEYYKALIQEVTKTAAATRTLEPKLAALRAFLQKDGVSLESIVEISDLISQLEAGMRRGAVDKEKNTFLIKLQEKGKEILNVPVDVGTSSLLKGLLKGLSRFEQVPGVLDMKQNLEQHMTAHRSSMASMELSSLLDNTVASREFDAAKLSDAVKACDRTTILGSLLDRMDDFLLELCQLSAGQAGPCVVSLVL